MTARNESSARRSRRSKAERWRQEGLCVSCGGERDAVKGANGIQPVRCTRCLGHKGNMDKENREKAQASIEEMRRQLAPFYNENPDGEVPGA